MSGRLKKVRGSGIHLRQVIQEKEKNSPQL